MATDVIMPQMGESIAEGTVTKWYKAVGQRVERDEPLFEISTDKVDTEIPSPSSGILSEIKVGEGETVPINTVVAIIGGEGAEAGSPVSEAAPAKTAEASPELAPEATTSGEMTSPAAPPATSEAGEGLSDAEAIASAASEGRDRGIRSSPLVRRMAREHGIDLAQVTGSGRSGRITREDVLSFLENEGSAAVPDEKPPETIEEPAVEAVIPPQPIPDVQVKESVEEPLVEPAPEPAPEPAQGGRVPMSVMRKSIAEHMIASRRTSAHVTTVFEADVSRIVRLREGYKKRFLKEENVKLTFTPFFIRAVIGGLRAFPVLNASIDGDDVLYKKEINLGMAVALDGGLIVPVIRNADERSFLGLAKAVVDLAERARRKKLNPDDVQGGTFTLTNPGPFGSLFGTPIISQPQVAILGLGSIHKRPVVVQDAIAIRSMVYLALSFDHRLIDGAVADQFMAEVKRRLESWDEKIL
jgi:2-oxoglutarate dehydrogenase E2 component (dihydrolipoamide succinyltransferase)